MSEVETHSVSGAMLRILGAPCFSLLLTVASRSASHAGRMVIFDGYSPAAIVVLTHARRVIPSGSSRNPMGAAALVLDRDQYAIHGTNSPGSIGHFVSYGCIRTYNADVMGLFDGVSVGTRVVVLR